MAVKAGECDIGLAVGVEKLAGAGLLGRRRSRKADDDDVDAARAATARSPPLDGRIGTETMPGVFAQIGMEYGHKYGGTSFELFAKISEKNHAHSTLNPLAAYQKRMTLEEIMNDVMIAYPNTRPMCSANCDGAAAAVVVSDAKLKTLSLEQQRRAVKVSASVLTTDPWEEACQVLPNVNTLTRNAAKQAYEQAGVGPDDLDLVELHDCFATAELVHYDNLDAVRARAAPSTSSSRGATVARRHDAGQRVRRPGVEGPPDRGHRHRQHLGGLPPPARRGRRPPDRGRQGRPGPRHRPRLGLRRPHPGEVRPGRLTRRSAERRRARRHLLEGVAAGSCASGAGQLLGQPAVVQSSRALVAACTSAELIAVIACCTFGSWSGLGHVAAGRLDGLVERQDGVCAASRRRP